MNLGPNSPKSQKKSLMGISILSVLLFALVSPVLIDFTIFHDQQHLVYYGIIFGLLFSMPVYDLYKQKFAIIPKLRVATVWLIILLTIGLGSVVYIFDRHKIAPTYRVNDIVIQQEVAIRMLLTNKNPYKETYFQTPLESFKYSPTEKNPALYHFVMEPFYLVSAIPFFVLESRTLGFFDSRVPLYLLFFAMLFFGYRIIKEKENKLLFIVLMSFNPMTLRFVLEGRSDMYMYPFLFAAFVLLHKNKLASASIFTAFAFAVKQTAWPFFPLFVIFLWFKTKSLKKVGKHICLFALIFGIIVVPFFLWNPRAFLDSTVFYLSGNTLHSYPISGYGFGSLLHEGGVIKNTQNYYPFITWQLIFGIPVLFGLFKLLKKNPTVKILILSYGLFLFVFWYFSRYFNDSHIGFISSILITALFWPEEEKGKKRKAI